MNKPHTFTQKPIVESENLLKIQYGSIYIQVPDKPDDIEFVDSFLQFWAKEIRASQSLNSKEKAKE